MKLILYIGVLVCAIIELARGETLQRIQRSPEPIAAPGPDPSHNYKHGGGYGHGGGYSHGGGYGYGGGYGHGGGYGYGGGWGRR